MDIQLLLIKPLLQTEFLKSLNEPKVQIIDHSSLLEDLGNEFAATIIITPQDEFGIDEEQHNVIAISEELEGIFNKEDDGYVHEFKVTYTYSSYIIIYTKCR